MFPDPHNNLDVLEALVKGLKGEKVHIHGLGEDNIISLNKAIGRLKSIGEVTL
jgi:hypothetical protein